MCLNLYLLLIQLLTSPLICYFTDEKMDAWEDGRLPKATWLVSGGAGYKPRSAPKPGYGAVVPENTFAWHLSLKWGHLLFLHLLLCKEGRIPKDSLAR